MNGAIILDKPAGITSHDAVRAVRRICRERSVGHTGTLDPFATGVLVLLLGKATRLARYFLPATKTYEAVMRVGFATDTYDFTGSAQGPDHPAELNEGELRQLFSEFVGTSLQRPPAYSAKKIAGVPAYRMARKGKPATLDPVAVTISDLRLIGIKDKLIRFCVTCSSGTYIRSLAHDLGERLGVGAHLSELRRTAVGSWRIEQAIALEQLDHQAHVADAPPALLRMEDLLPELPACSLTESEYARVINGLPVSLDSASEHVRLFSPHGALAAIAKREGSGWYHPQVVLSTGATAALPAVPA